MLIIVPTLYLVQGLAPPRQTLSSEQTIQSTPKPTTNGVTKRITTPHACAECKRRKIRCDGRQPCGQCVGCRSPKSCYYDKHRQRVIPSRKYDTCAFYMLPYVLIEVEPSMLSLSPWKNAVPFYEDFIQIERCNSYCHCREMSSLHSLTDPHEAHFRIHLPRALTLPQYRRNIGRP